MANDVAEKSKVCIRCQQAKPLTSFYANKGWKEQQGRDIWCRDCVSQCRTREMIREYFWDNNREWSDQVWAQARTKAERMAATNLTYQKSNDERRKAILDTITCQQIPTIMNSAGLYKFVDNTAAGKYSSFKEAEGETSEFAEKEDPNEKFFSEKFNGWFTKAELAYLDDYYDGLDADFDLSDTNLRDIAKKLAKASLQADKAQDMFSAGRCDYSVVKDALSQFDLLSKSGNFAACKRKPGDNNGLGSWAEITYKLETTGHPCTRKIEWPKDDVDKTIDEFRYIVEALGLDSM